MNNQKELDFSTILATNVHDIKNALFMLLQSIEHLDKADNLTADQHKSFARLHQQASSVNSTFMQLLSLYRDEQKQLPIYIEENSVHELFDDLMDRHRLYLNTHDINVNISVEKGLHGFYDADLIFYLLSDIFVNALRHAKSKINIRAYYKQPFLTFNIEDDGEGYPCDILDDNHKENEFYNFNPNEGNSGLGLIFAKKIAQAHKSNDLIGEIELQNKTDMTGSMFTLRLP